MKQEITNTFLRITCDLCKELVPMHSRIPCMLCEKDICSHCGFHIMENRWKINRQHGYKKVGRICKQCSKFEENKQ